MAVVLIETLWNVNKRPYNYIIYIILCINRNIVECKSFSGGKMSTTSTLVLIETLWNVNVYICLQSSSRP